MGIAPALRRLLYSMARRLGAAPRIALAAGGSGYTDRVTDLAYYEGASFEEVVTMLLEVAGSPSRTWDELAQGRHEWYLDEAGAGA
jgi:hypothetical protein